MNTKKIAMYVGTLVILVIVALLLDLNAGGSSPIHALPTSSSSTTSSTSVSTSPTSSTTHQSTYTFCTPSTYTSTPVYNGNFSTGTYKGWNATGKAFGSAPLNLTYQNEQHDYYGAPWSGYNGTFMASTFQGFISGQGNLTSSPFLVTEPYLNFKIISAQNKGLYIEVLSGNSIFERVYFNTFNASVTSNYLTTYLNGSINLYPLLCQNASVRIVSDLQASISSRYSYISAGDFYLGPSPVQTPGITVNPNLTSVG